MLGAIIGDVIGSIYEHNNIKTKEFELINVNCRFTDDTILTLAVAQGLMKSNINNEESVKSNVRDSIIEICTSYPNAGYGGRFRKWLQSQDHTSYNSYGNGSAMRVSPVAWVSDDLDMVLRLAKNTAEVTHNHPEGIKGAQAVATAILLARQNKNIEKIREYIEENFYGLDFTLDEIRESYTFDVSCQGSVPQAIVAFLESISFEDAIRNAISIGGDSDTIAAIAGSIAEAYYGVPDYLKNWALGKLDNRLRAIVEEFRCGYLE